MYSVEINYQHKFRGSLRNNKIGLKLENIYKNARNKNLDKQFAVW